MATTRSTKPLIRHSNRNCLHCSLRPNTPVYDATSVFLESLNAVKQEVYWPAKQLLQSKQLPPDQVLVVQQGFVSVGGSSATGDARLLGIAGPGQALFVEQLLPAIPSFGELRTLTRFFGCLIPLQFLKFGEDLRGESLCFLGQSTRFYQRSLLRMQQFAHANVEERLMLCISHVQQVGGFSATGELQLPLRRLDWAALAQITTESAIRGLAKLEVQGLIEKKGRLIQLAPAFKLSSKMTDFK